MEIIVWSEVAVSFIIIEAWIAVVVMAFISWPSNGYILYIASSDILFASPEQPAEQ